VASKPEILLAEDEEHIAKLVAFKLGREGFAVTVAKNGQEAIDLAETRQWALAILDIMMPFQDGWAVLKVIRERHGSEMPVLMLTAKGLGLSPEDLQLPGKTRFLKKPFDPAELARIVRAMLEQTE